MTTRSFAFVLHENILQHTPAHVQGVFARISENNKFLEGNGDSGAQNLATKDCNSIMLAVVPAVWKFPVFHVGQSSAKWSRRPQSFSLDLRLLMFPMSSVGSPWWVVFTCHSLAFLFFIVVIDPWFYLCDQSENSQLETKLSGLPVSSVGKRDSVLGRAAELNDEKKAKSVSVSRVMHVFSCLRCHFMSLWLQQSVLFILCNCVQIG